MNAKAATTDTAKLEALGNGRFKISGILNAVTVGKLLEHSEALFKGAPRLDIDLAGVPEGDSAGLALLIEWVRLARHNKQEIHFANLPTQIAALARISEVEDLVTNGANHHPAK
jgi:phospholipid transport system transporter-binding protein